MLSEQQQRIMGYFIEEAKDHLNTLEQGLLNLQSTIADPEMVSEVFRAAHSVKGGAAMLGLSSIQHTAHRLEDYFKILKECPVKIDQRLESLFLRVFDTLQELVDQLQGPFGLTEDRAQEAMAEVEPVFTELGQHLSLLVSQAGSVLPEDLELPIAVPIKLAPKQPAIAREESALQLIFQSDVPAQLREMLQRFKQADTQESRQQLQRICRTLSQPGEQLDLPNWCTLLGIAEGAIGNPDNTYRTLAPVIIKEIKQAQEQILAGHHAEIAASAALLKLMPSQVVEDVTDTAFNDLLTTVDAAEPIHEPIYESIHEPIHEPIIESLSFDELPDFANTTDAATGFSALNSPAPNSPALDLAETADFSDSWFNDEPLDIALPSSTASFSAETDEFLDFDLQVPDAEGAELTSGLTPEMPLDNLFDALDLSQGQDPSLEGASNAPRTSGSLPQREDDHAGPEMSIAELNSLADLFEGEVPDLGLTWEDEQVNGSTDEFLGTSEVDASSDFSDFLFDQDGTEDLVLDGFEDDDLSGLLNNSAQSLSVSASPTPLSEADSLFESIDASEIGASEIGASEIGAFEIGAPEIGAPEIGAFDSELQFELDSSQTDGLADVLFADTSKPDVTQEDLFGADTSNSRNAGTFENLDDLLAGLDMDIPTTDLPDDAIASELSELDAIFGDALTSDSLFEDSLDEPGSEAMSLSEGSLELKNFSDGSQPDRLELSTDPWEDSAAIALPLSEPAPEPELPADLTNSEDFDWFEVSSEPVRFDAAGSSNLSSDEATFSLDLPTDQTTAEISEPGEESGFRASEAFSPSLDSLELDSLRLDSLRLDSLEPDSLELDGLDTIFGTEDSVAVEDSVGADASLLDFSFDDSEPSDSELATPEAIDFNTTDFNTTDFNTTDFNTTDFNTTDFNTTDLDNAQSDNAQSDNASTHQAEFDPFFAPDSETSTDVEFQGFESSEDDWADVDLADMNLAEVSLPEATLPEATLPEAIASHSENTFNDHDFGDLEAMLGEDQPGELSSFISSPASSSAASGVSTPTVTEADDFADLEAMLEESAPELMMGAAAMGAAAIGASDLETAASSAEADDFADLEAMLGEDQPDANFSEAIASPSELLGVEDEFGDLEELLEDVKQKLGGSSAQRGNRQATPANRRSNRRNALSDQTMRVSVKHLDNLNNLVGEMVVNRNSLEQAQERLRQFLDNLLYQVQQLSDVGQRMRDLYERSLLESSLLSNRRSYHLSPQSSFAPVQSNHATGASFDALEMDRFTGFHTLSQEMIELIVRVRESASDIDFVVEESDQVTRNFRQITTQLQEGLTRSRMVPFAQTADRLPRGVRDNSLKYGKQSELHIEGRDTLIDKMIVEQLYDPMTHLVNNAVAHGIETPAVRVAAGKPPTGRITIRAFHQGNQTIISVSDDGGGIDPDYVKSKAVARGLITAAEAKEMTRLDVYDLLFHHGFSTADQVDDLRGRGVGLDVVRSNLNEIRGVISIDSAIGKGTTFTIRLPLTLSISKALCCISNRARVAFPMDGVEDMIDVPKERVQTDEQGQTSIYWREAWLPFQPLSALLGYNRILGRGSVYGGNQEEDIISIVILRSAGNYLALQIDQVLGEQEIVIKQLEGPVPKPVGVAGATVLGDGRIMPIADVLELIDLSEGRIRREAGSSLWDKSDELPPEPADLKTEPTVLIVDDSITVRELLSMTFNKVGYRVEQARDGQEAWEKLRSGLPCDLVFCDIEMPRMDGLELLSRIQKDPTLAHLPIAMLTSRGADRHRQMAVQLGAKGYFTKPYLEEGLLDAAQRMLKGEVLVNTNV